jgi:rod shape-determining protein MreC
MFPRALKIYLSVGASFVLILISHYLGWLVPVEIFLRSLIFPGVAAVNSFSVQAKDSYRWFKNKEEFIASYQEISNQLQDQQLLEATVDLLTDENRELRQQIEFKQATDVKLITANVVGRGSNAGAQTIIINKGLSHGVNSNLPIIVGQGVVVGKVTKVEPDISVITLIDDNQSKIGATILNVDRSLGVVEGGYGISLRLKFIPRNETVLVGDKVITSGLESNVPRGLLVGTVAAVENEAYKPFQQAVITPAANLSKLTIVSVLVNKKE